MWIGRRVRVGCWPMRFEGEGGKRGLRVWSGDVKERKGRNDRAQKTINHSKKITLRGEEQSHNWEGRPRLILLSFSFPPFFSSSPFAPPAYKNRNTTAMASSHRPPVLFQSDDDDHHHHHHQHHDNSDHSHHAFGDAHTADPRSPGLLGHQHNDLLHGQGSTHTHPHTDGRGHSQERGHEHLYDELENLDDPPPHVHSQVCLDSCPVQDIYTETSFSRFSKGART